MAFDKNIPRWIFASISKHFDDRKDSVHLYIEGQERSTSDLLKYFELRVDGPFIVEQSKNYYMVAVEINVLCTAKQDLRDNFVIHRLTGIMAAAFTKTINVFKFGDNDSELFMCLQLRTDKKEQIAISHFGQVEADAKVSQATVEGHYRGHFDGSD